MPDQAAPEPSETSAPAAAGGVSGAITGGALVWSLLLGALLIAAAVMGSADAPTVIAILSAAAPGLVTQRLRRPASDRVETLVVASWGLGGGLAAALTGGLAGPFGALAAAPLAIAAALDRPRRVSLAVAVTLAVAAVDLWVSFTNLVEPPSGTVAPWMSLMAVGGAAATLGVAIRLSLSRRSERARKSEEAALRLETLLAEQPHLILTLDTRGRIGSAFGAPPPGISVETLTARGLVAAAHHSDRPAVQAALFRAATHGTGEAGFAPEAALDCWTGLDVRRAADGRLIGVLRDASVSHAREAQLETARQEAEHLNAGKSRFLANMSHELRTPLNAVLGFSDIMRQRLFGPLPDRYAEYAGMIHESGRHLLDLINDVLDMSKIEAERYELSLEPFDARDPVSSALRLVRLQAHESRITLRGVLPPEAVMVEADKRALKQITLNLLSNALKFTPPGGSVTVTLAADGRALELGVADTGVGISPEDLKRLGRPFEQAGDADQKTRGTGLGLSLVRAFAELHGGVMNVESVLGDGAAVTVRLPVVLEAGSNAGRGAQVIRLSGRS